MIPVYAVRLTILSAASHPAPRLFGDVVGVCHQWLIRLGQTWETEIPSDWEANYGTGNSEIGTRFSAEHVDVAGERAWRVVALHPYKDIASTIQMRVEIQVRDCVDEVVVTLRLMLGSVIDSIRPISIDLRRPRLIIDLLNAFPKHVSSGNMRATRYATYLESEQQVVADLIEDKITRTTRRAPVVVISRTEDQLLPLQTSTIDRLASELAGLARVYVLPTYEAAYALTHHLTYKLSCFRGAIRVYWPDFGIDDNPFVHPLWTVDRIQRERLQEALPQHIFNLIASASALGIVSDQETWRLYRTHAAQQREREQADLLKRLEQQSLEAKAGHEINQQITEALLEEAQLVINGLQIDIDGYIAEIERIEAREKQLEGTVREVQAHNELLQHTIKGNHGNESSDRSLVLKRALGAKNLVDIIRLVQDVSSEDYLVFLPRALDSAASAPYRGSLLAVFEKLICIRNVARRYHSGDSAGHKKLFEEEGEPGYRANVSDTARQQFRSDYECPYATEEGTETIVLGPHISNGSGAPNTTAVIYWYIDDKRRKYVIGHVGRHLRGRRDT